MAPRGAMRAREAPMCRVRHQWKPGQVVVVALPEWPQGWLRMQPAAVLAQGGGPEAHIWKRVALKPALTATQSSGEP